MPKKRRSTSKNEVGYRHPPRATQFKKGSSGNPRGRPKGSRNIGKVLRDVTGQKIAVTENGRTRRMPALEVMLRKLTNDAMRADPRALKAIFSLMDRYGDVGESDTAPNIDEVLAEDQVILERYLKTFSGTAAATSEDAAEEKN